MSAFGLEFLNKPLGQRLSMQKNRDYCNKFKSSVMINCNSIHNSISKIYACSQKCCIMVYHQFDSFDIYNIQLVVL